MDKRSNELLGKISRAIGDARRPGDAIRNVKVSQGPRRSIVGICGPVVRGHKRAIKPKLHKGTQRTCAVCNPESFLYWRRQEAKLKAFGKSRGGL